MMNSSAKILFTLVCAGALGAVAIACTVSSGTVDNTDGGSSSGAASSSSSSSSSSSGSTTTDAGDSGPTGPECTAVTTDINDNDSADCKACLRHSCCEQITAYEQKAEKDPNTGLLGTDDYAAQLVSCDENADPDDCKALVKKNPPTQDGVPDIYNAYLACRDTSCATQCAGVAEADGGTK